MDRRVFSQRAVVWSVGLVSVVAGVLVGCGGSGGGPNPTTGLPFGPCSVATANGRIDYTTFWGDAPQSASQIVQILDVDGTVVRTDSLNRNQAGSSSLVINSVPAGVYRLRALMYPQANAGGMVSGEAWAVADLCAGGAGGSDVLISTSNNSTPNRIQVYIDSLSLIEEQTTPYMASVMSNSTPVFIPQNSVQWSVIGGVGTITQTGGFTATASGTGSIQASYQSLVGSAAVTVTERQVTQGKWTVLVYMNAANDLYTYSTLNMNQMESVANNPDVRFVVQWKQSKTAFSGSTFDGVRRYLVQHDPSPDFNSASNPIVSELVQTNLRNSQGNALDMGSPQTLNDFITWGKANYPADRYILIVWNHGNGWRRSIDDSGPTRAFSYDDQYGTAIQTWQTDTALAGHTFDILAWDASLMQMLEVAYEARPYADYIVGSEESPPGEGYPYHLVFDQFRSNPDLSTAILTKNFVDGMVQNPPYASRKITQSVLDSSRLEDLAASVSTLGAQLEANQAQLTTVIPNIRNAAQSYSPTTTRVYRDLVHLCELLEANTDVPQAVKTAAVDVRAKVAAAIVWEGHNSFSANSHGVSIDFSSSGSFPTSRQDYLRLKFAQDTLWDEWLSVAP